MPQVRAGFSAAEAGGGGVDGGDGCVVDVDMGG